MSLIYIPIKLLSNSWTFLGVNCFFKKKKNICQQNFKEQPFPKPFHFTGNALLHCTTLGVVLRPQNNFRVGFRVSDVLQNVNTRLATSVFLWSWQLNWYYMLGMPFWSIVCVCVWDTCFSQKVNQEMTSVCSIVRTEWKQLQNYRLSNKELKETYKAGNMKKL